MTRNAERSLIQRAKAGEVGAWELLILRYQFSLQDYIRCRYDHCLSALVSPEDILQESLLQAWLDIRSLKQTAPSSFFAWLKSVADRRVCDALKSQRRLKRGGQMRRATNSKANANGSWHDLLDALPAEAKTASSILSRKEAALALQVAVSLLPEDQQTALRMYDLEGKTLGETAAAMNRTNAAVRGLLHRGKQRLTLDFTSASSWLGARTEVPCRLTQFESGDSQASERLLALVHDEIREIMASRQIQDKLDQTVPAKAIIHEALRRLAGTDQPLEGQSRGRFLAAAAEGMRRILIDRARKKQNQTHSGDPAEDLLDKLEITVPEPSVDLLTLNNALQRLADTNPLKAELVKLRYFAGLSIPEAADALGITKATADRDWAFARAWLHAEMKKGDGGAPG